VPAGRRRVEETKERRQNSLSTDYLRTEAWYRPCASTRKKDREGVCIVCMLVLSMLCTNFLDGKVCGRKGRGKRLGKRGGRGAGVVVGGWVQVLLVKGMKKGIDQWQETF